MRWPSFTDQRIAVENFYKPAGYALRWTVDTNHPTEQALALITALQSADKQGLRPDDYDGPVGRNVLPGSRARPRLLWIWPALIWRSPCL